MADARPTTPRHTKPAMVLTLPNLSLSEPQRQRVTRVWLRYHIPFSAALAVAAVGLAAFVGWAPGYVVAALPLLTMVYAAHRRRAENYNPPFALLVVHVTAIFFSMGLAGLEDAALGVLYAYISLTAIILLKPLLAAWIAIYAAVWFWALVADVIPFAPVGQWTSLILAVVANAIFGLALIGITGMVMSIINRESDRREHRVRLEHALAAFSAVLLDPQHDDPLEPALNVLLEATEAGAVFVQRNIEHPALGLCSTLEREALHQRSQARPRNLWSLIPWSTLPDAAKDLGSGRPHLYDLDALTPDMADRFSRSSIRSELAFPIFIDGSWFGVIGFNDMDAHHAWSTSDRVLLSTTAQILGTHYQRAAARRELTDHVMDLDQQRRYQTAIAQCSAALLTSTDDGAVEAALQSLLLATEADYAYVTHNFHDPDAGPSAEIVHEASRPGTPGTEPGAGWYRGPYSQLPTSYDALSRGEIAVIHTSRLRGEERLLYEADGLRSEICLPVMVHGEWQGSIAFAAYTTEREWDHTEIAVLRTAAEMIGAFWERRSATEQREHLVATLNWRLEYEEALSRCSQALLMSTEDDALDAAMRSLLAATDSHIAFLEVNADDPDHGKVARRTHEIVRPGYETVVATSVWIEEAPGSPAPGVTAWAHLPSVRERLEQGLPAVVDVASLNSLERQLYLDDVTTELSIPIFIGGRWWGTVGFANYFEPRTWLDAEVAMLRTAAEMFAAFWERRQARTRLEEMIRSKDEFVAAVSHELRTPLTTVVGLSHELRSRRDDFTTEEVNDFVDLIADQSAEVANLVEDLLVAARSDTGTLVIAPTPVDLEAEIRTLLDLDRSLSGRLAIEVTGTCGKAWTDPGRFRQIFRNLLTNADRYGGSHVNIVLRDTPGGVAVAVSDDGPGVPLARRDTIFEPYGTAHEPSTQPASVGLGLAVARSLARLMGGDLVHERRTGWTVFELRLLGADAIHAGHHDVA